MLARLNIAVNTLAARKSLRDFDRDVNRSANNAEKRTKGMRGAFGGVVRSIFSLRNAIAGISFGLIARDIIKTTLEVERLKIGLNALSNDMGKTNKRFNSLKAFANELGVDFMTTAGAFKQFGIAVEATGLEATEAERIFRSFITAGAAMQMTNDEMKGSLLAVSQMFSKGKVSAEELRGQLGERLAPAFSLAAESVGLTTAELDKALASGNILATGMVPKLATILEERFGEGAKSASKSATAQFNRFGNAMTDLKVVIGESGLVSAFSNLAQKITNFVRNGDLATWIHSSLLGIAAFLKGAADLQLTFNRMTGGIGSVYESLREMYNNVNQFAGGYLAEMGIIGYMLLGGRKGAFIGIMVGILAGAADKLIEFIHTTLKKMLEAARGYLPGEIGTSTIKSFEDARPKGIASATFDKQNPTAQVYAQRQIAKGFTQNADGTFGKQEFQSALPGGTAIYNSLTSGINSLEQAITDRENGQYSFTSRLDVLFDKIYSSVGLTPSDGMGGLPSFGGGLSLPGSGKGDYSLANALTDFADTFKRNADGMKMPTTSEFGTQGTSAKPGKDKIVAGSQAAQDILENFDTKLLTTFDNLREFMQAGGDLGKRFGEGISEGFESALMAAVDFKKFGLDVVEKGFGFLDSAIDGFISGTKVSFKAFVSDMLAMLAKLLVKMMIFKALGGTKFGDFIGIPAPTGGQQAGGGGIQAGRGYLVGERGPEMFFPRMGGHMVPNQALAGGGGGGVTINNHYDFSNADDSVAARLHQTAETIKQETFSKVFGAIEHGGRFAKATGRRG